MTHPGLRPSLSQDGHNGLYDRMYRFQHVNWASTQKYGDQPRKQVVVASQDFGTPPLPGHMNAGHVEQVHSEQEFDDQLSSSDLVVLDVYTDWCEPCKEFAPIYESIAAQNSWKVKFLKMDAQENESTLDLARNVFRAKSVPTFYFFRGGKFVSEVSGVAEAQFRSNLERLMSLA